MYLNGDSYEGQWFDDKKNGNGRSEHDKNGNVVSIYIGRFEEDKRSGKGSFFDILLEEVYEGDWDNDRRNGEGVIVKKSGEVLSGDFRNDMMEGKKKTEKSLTQAQVEKVFCSMKSVSEYFIAVKKNK